MANTTTKNATTTPPAPPAPAPPAVTTLSVPLMQYIQRVQRSFYYYNGSFTTPPCTEDVNYIVMAEVQYISFQDMQQFQRFWSGNQYFANGNGNNRALQQLNNRSCFFNQYTHDMDLAALTNQYMLPQAAM